MERDLYIIRDRDSGNVEFREGPTTTIASVIPLGDGQEFVGVVSAKPTAPLEAPVSPTEVWERLSDRQRNCLQALFEFRAFEVDARRNATEVAQRTDGGTAKGNSFKEPLTRLVKSGLAKSRSHRGGGYWLSLEGRALIEAHVGR